MPPKAAKEKVIKGDEAEELVLDYLRSVNRPYSSTDVAANLKGKVPKAAAQKIMLALADRGDVVKKDYGKQQVFVYNQASLSVLSPQELSELDSQTKDVNADLSERRDEMKNLTADLALKVAAPKTKELGKAIEDAQTEKDKVSADLEQYRGTANGGPTIRPISKEEAKKIDDEFSKWRKEWVDRKKVYKELIGTLRENGSIENLTQFEEDQGVVADDAETVAVEQSEFVRPAPAVIKAKPNGVKTKASTPAIPPSKPKMKRPVTPSDSGQSQEQVPKKKAKASKKA